MFGLFRNHCCQKSCVLGWVIQGRIIIINISQSVTSRKLLALLAHLLAILCTIAGDQNNWTSDIIISAHTHTQARATDPEACIIPTIGTRFPYSPCSLQGKFLKFPWKKHEVYFALSPEKYVLGEISTSPFYPVGVSHDYCPPKTLSLSTDIVLAIRERLG